MDSRSKSILRTTPMIRCLKVLLAIFNFIFLVTGIAILVLGVWTKVELYKYLELTTDYNPQIPIVLIATGCGILVFGALGCACLFKGTPCFLYVYAIFLFIIFIVELSAGIAGLVMKNKLQEGFEKGLNDAVKNYASKKGPVDKIQNELQCCGVTTYKDWFNTTWSGSIQQVPESCCKKGVPVKSCIYKAPTTGANLTNINTEGCYKKVVDFTQNNVGAIGGSVVGFSFIQLFGAVFAYFLGKALRKQSYDQVT